jgi:hypothetical protein
MTGQTMTPAQENLLLTLAGKVLGKPIGHLSQARSVLAVSNSAIGRGLTKSEASACIDDLKRQIDGAEQQAAARETTPVTTGTLTAQNILDMLGRNVEITYTAADGEARTLSSKVDSIVPSSMDSTPALRFATLGKTIRASVVTAWRVL